MPCSKALLGHSSTDPTTEMTKKQFRIEKLASSRLPRSCRGAGWVPDVFCGHKALATAPACPEREAARRVAVASARYTAPILRSLIEGTYVELVFCTLHFIKRKLLFCSSGRRREFGNSRADVFGESHGYAAYLSPAFFRTTSNAPIRSTWNALLGSTALTNHAYQNGLFRDGPSPRGGLSPSWGAPKPGLIEPATHFPPA